MKYIFMSLVLSLTSSPVVADNTATKYRCLEMYHSYLNYNTARQMNPEKILKSYADMCLPESALRDDPLYLKLLQITDDDRGIPTIQAGLPEKKLFI